MSKFNEVRIDYTDDNGVTHIDGWKTGDENEDGVTIGYFINGEVYWTNPDYQFDEMIKEAVSKLKQ